MLAVGAVFGSLLLAAVAQPAHALDGQIPDPGFAQCVNHKIDAQRPADQPIQLDEVQQLRGALSCASTSQAGAPPIRNIDGIGPARLTALQIFGGHADLSDPGSLADLPSLSELKRLDLREAHVTDDALGHIGQVAGITTLNLYGNPRITTLEPIAPLVKLAHLDIQNLPADPGVLTSLAGLEGMPDLATLFTTFNDIRSTAPLAGKTKLTQIGMASNSLTDVDGIADSKGLSIVILSKNPGIEGKLDALAGNHGLSVLRIDGTGATNLRFLEGLTNLGTLEAANNSISTLEGLEPLAGASLSIHGQFVDIPEKLYVPEGATEFRFDANGQLALRDGTFPEVTLMTIVDPQGPILETDIVAGQEGRIYGFAADMPDYQTYSGTVQVHFEHVTLDVSKMPTGALTGDTYSGEPFVANVTQGGAEEPGFVVARYELADDAPDWLSIDAATGEVSGTPTQDGPVSYTVRASDALDNVVSGTVSVTVASAPKITFEGTLPHGTVGQAYTETVVTATGTPVLEWAATGLPSGLAIHSETGAISGTPTSAGTFTVTVTVTNAHGVATETYEIAVRPAPTVVDPGDLGATPGTQGKPGGGGSDPLSQTGGAPTLPFALAGAIALGAGVLLLARRRSRDQR